MTENRGPAGTGATIVLDSQGFLTCAARNFNDTMGLVSSASAPVPNVLEAAVTGVQTIAALESAAPDFALGRNTLYVKPSRVELALASSCTAPCTVVATVYRTKRPYSVGSLAATPSYAGAGDPVSVANYLYALAQPDAAASGSAQNVRNVLFPHTSLGKAPGFHDLFEVVDTCSSKLTHGQSKTCHLHLPGSRLRPSVDYPSNVGVSYNGVPKQAIPHYDLFIVCNIKAVPPVAYYTGAGAGAVEAGAGAVLVSARWIESWTDVAAQKGWNVTPFTVGNSITVAAAAGAGYQVMNQFGTAAANANPPVL